MASLTGKELGNYRIEKRIGRGGMAEVYQGVHINLDRNVAIKVLHGYLAEGGDFIARFKREAKAVANLRHPNIVQVHDFDVQDEIIFMVMEYINGTNLQQRLVDLDKKGERLSITQIGSIINDIAGALDYAHSKGMLHRDVKPSNILLDSNDKAYLTDFGIAKILSDQKFTATGTLIGTPAYMSPEQGMGEELSKESDIYSLGVVAFEMITGQVPYDAKTPIAIVQKQISDPIPHIKELVKNVPDKAQDVIDMALAKAPESRYSSAEALVIALRTALHALEAADPSLKTTAASASKVDRDELISPTVEMQDVSTPQEFDQPTVLMEDGELPESIAESAIVKESVPEEKKEDQRLERDADEIKSSFFSSTRNRILIGVAGIVLVGAVVIGVQSLGNTPASPDQTQTTEPTEQTAPQGEMSGEEYYDQANSLMSQDKWAEAVEYYDRALDAGYEIADLHHLKALANTNIGNIDAAIAGWTVAIELDGEIHVYWRERGIRRLENGDLSGALEDLNRALELYTDDPITYRALSSVHYDLGQVSAAIDDAIQAARIEPNNIYNYLALTAAYLVHESTPRQAEEAMEVLDMAIEFDPTNPEVRILRGRIYWYEWGDDENALEEFDLAVENNYPGWAAPYDSRGLFYLETGQCDLAVGDFTDYLSMDTENPWIYQMRGECYAQLGEDGLARNDYGIFLVMTDGDLSFDDLRQTVLSWLDAHPE